jgi:hypothetical protein
VHLLPYSFKCQCPFNAVMSNGVEGGGFISVSQNYVELFKTIHNLLRFFLYKLI